MAQTQKPTLKRSFNLSSLVVYGVGSILGAGIYTVIGKVAGVAGSYLWFSFAIALFISLLTALSYAELSKDYAASGAEVNFLHHAFKKNWLSAFVGWLIICATTVAMATLAHAFAGYFKVLAPQIPEWSIFVGFLSILGAINFWGIQESSHANIIATVIELSGLIMVIIAAIFLLSGSSVEFTQQQAKFSWGGILQGVSLAFFAFIGFEDIANVADETKDPKRNVPRALIVATLLTGVVYLIVAWLTSRASALAQMSASNAPLLEIVKASPLQKLNYVFTFIPLFAVANTALLNSITASRMIYAMAKKKFLPQVLSNVHQARHTPHIAILAVIVAASTLALLGHLALLAEMMSFLLLLVFALVHASLIKIKLSHKKKNTGFPIPIFFPALGILCNLFIMSFANRKSQLGALAIIACGLLVVAFFQRFKK